MPIKMAIIQKPENKYWQEFGKIGTLCVAGKECKIVWPLLKTVQQFLKKKKFLNETSNYHMIQQFLF